MEWALIVRILFIVRSAGCFYCVGRRFQVHSYQILCPICSMSEGNEFYTEWTESYESFDQMNLHENLLRGIYAYGALQDELLVVDLLGSLQ